MESFEVLVELLVTGAYALGTLALTGAGVLVERASVHELLVGDGMLGVWLAVMGLAMLYGGLYLLGYEGLLGRLRSDSRTA